MAKYFISAAALLAATQAAPTGSSSSSGSTCEKESVLATFDDLTALPAVSEINPVGTYKDLNWQGLDVLQAGLLGITTGVLPESSPNTAVNGVTDDVLQGAISITADTVKSFDLNELYFGCVANTVETVASVPIVCTVAFTGYKVGSDTPYKTINQQFSPTNAVVSKMVKAEFDDFCDLDRLDVAVVESTATSTLTGLLIDNVSYNTCGGSSSSTKSSSGGLLSILS